MELIIGAGLVLAIGSGAIAAAPTQAEALALVTGFANDYVRDAFECGHAIGRARAIDEIPVDPEAPELARALIPVEVG